MVRSPSAGWVLSTPAGSSTGACHELANMARSQAGEGLVGAAHGYQPQEPECSQGNAQSGGLGGLDTHDYLHPESH